MNDLGRYAVRCCLLCRALRSDPEGVEGGSLIATCFKCNNSTNRNHRIEALIASTQAKEHDDCPDADKPRQRCLKSSPIDRTNLRAFCRQDGNSIGSNQMSEHVVEHGR